MEKEISKAEFKSAMTKLILKAWTDEDFKTSLQKKTNEALNSLGIPIPNNVNFSVLFNTEDTFNIVIPAKPTSSEIRESDFLTASAQLAAHEQLVLPTILVRN
ncbi:nitrile hydratase subunit alpha [Chryseobacterium potabilaquae]|uniref:Nitrile hydratase alpha/Thiocyanate hydrolase gamma domain-containing protein n=1 Tax=Chryseobacterium potabilaquae TaxID=2675057 RepID=A0A6N4XFB1_9FLAO|nr:hypothetical protein CHRY9293_03402 [Chryseobacterium potabilaquae]